MQTVKAIQKNLNYFFTSPNKEHYHLPLLLLLSFVVRVIYVFDLTKYKEYLFSDMGVYWGRALDRYKGDIFSQWQWSAWGPFYNFTLTFLFKIIDFFNVFEYRLEIILFLNILLAVISVYCVYHISLQIYKNHKFAILTSSAYSFCYPLIYYNTFIMSENFAIPLLIFSVYLLFQHSDSKLILFLNGLIFGVALGLRGTFIFIPLAYVFYLINPLEKSIKKYLKSICFFSGVALVVFLIIVENSYVSKGQLKSIAGNSGLNFFITFCKVVNVQSVYKGFNYDIGTVSPINPRVKLFQTEHHINDQEYFYNLGIDCIKKNPGVLIENLLDYKGMFFGPFLPSMTSAKWFIPLIKVWEFIIFFMAISLGLFYYFLKKVGAEINVKKIKFLFLLISCLIFMMYFFGVEKRFLFPGYFAIHILFFLIVFHLKTVKDEARKYIKIVAGLIFAYYFLFKLI